MAGTSVADAKRALRCLAALHAGYWEDYAPALSEKDAKLAQKLGQLQHFLAVLFPPEARANWHLLGQPNISPVGTGLP